MGNQCSAKSHLQNVYGLLKLGLLLSTLKQASICCGLTSPPLLEAAALVAVGNIYLPVPSAVYSPAVKICAVVTYSLIHFLIS